MCPMSNRIVVAKIATVPVYAAEVACRGRSTAIFFADCMLLFDGWKARGTGGQRAAANQVNG